MIIKTFVTTPFQQNTRILVCEDTKKAICIDPGDSADLIADYIETNGFSLEALTLTHAHLDHIGGVSGMRKRFPQVEIFLHRDDEEMYFALPQQPIRMGIPPHQLKALGMDYEVPPKLTRYWQDGEIYTFGNTKLKIIHTPGHSPGHVVFFAENENKLFGGDCLFAGSIGRTDLPGGDYDTLINSIKTKILPLGDDVEVFAGHGENTLIGREKIYNPFLTGAYQSIS